MKKSLVSFALAASLLVTAAVPAAFAATTPSDAVGVKEQSAIEELVALGIINGYEDGTFKPNNNITRAQLAKIVVEATGGKNAAALMNSVKPVFKDVKINEWYTGYINVASTKGFIQGYNGNFRPSDNIKFEEVVAILIRALGYSDKNLLGAWPYNVLVKAEDIGLFNKVDIQPGTLATRGIVAQITNNSLSENLVQWNAETQLYQNVTGNPILISKLGTTKSEVVKVGSISNNRVTFASGPVTLASNYVITGGKKLSELVGREVTVLLNNDDPKKVLAITDSQSVDRQVTGKLEVALTQASTTVKVKEGDTVLDPKALATGAFVSINGDLQTGAFTIATGTDVVVYLNSAGEIRYVVATKNAIANSLFDSYIAKTATASARIVTNKGAVNVDENTVVTINGEVKAVTDLGKNDVVNVVANAALVASKVEATRQVAQGKVTAKKPSVNGDLYYTVGGTDYKAVDNTLALALDSEYKLFLNKDKQIAGVELLVPGAADNKNAIILEAKDNVVVIENGVYDPGNTKDIITYYSIKEDKKVTVNLAATFFADQAAADAVENSYVTWTLKNDGTIDAIADSDELLASDKVVTDVTATTVKTDSVYNINANTVVLNAKDADHATPADRKVTKSEFAKIGKGNDVYIVADGIYAKYIIVTNDASTASNPTKFGIFVGATEIATSGGSTYTITLNVNGSATNDTIAVEQGVYTSAQATLNADNKTLVALTDAITPGGAYDAVAPVAVSNTVDAVDLNSNNVKVDGTDYIINNDTVVFVVDENNAVTTGLLADVVAVQYNNTNTYNVYVGLDATNTVAGKSVVKTIVIKKLSNQTQVNAVAAGLTVPGAYTVANAGTTVVTSAVPSGYTVAATNSDADATVTDAGVVGAVAATANVTFTVTQTATGLTATKTIAVTVGS